MRVSSLARIRRANTGEAPPVETAAMTGERSMIDGIIKVQKRRLVHDVDRDSTGLGGLVNRAVDRLIVGSGDGKNTVIEQRGLEGRFLMLDFPFPDQPGQDFPELGAQTTTRAPALSSSLTFRAATSPPPMRAQGAVL